MRLRELAESLGLSPTTVSRALAGYGDVSDATRAKVVAAARKHGYRPSASASRLAKGRSRTIGHVVPLIGEMRIDPHFSDFIAGSGEVYGERGYDMLLSMVRPEEETEAYRTMSGAGSVDGVIVHAPRVVEPRIALLNELGLPFIVHGRCGSPEAGYSWLDVDNRRAFVRATNFLADLGHRRIALFNGPETLNFAWRRRTGHLDAVAARGLERDGRLLFNDAMTEPNGYEWARLALSLAPPPTAILASSVLLAMGALRAVQELGLKPGRDVSIVTYDDRLSFLENARSVPFFTSTRSSIREAGRRCAQLLIAQIEEQAAEPVTELWETELVVGSSTGPAPAAAFRDGHSRRAGRAAQAR